MAGLRVSGLPVRPRYACRIGETPGLAGLTELTAEILKRRVDGKCTALPYEYRTGVPYSTVSGVLYEYRRVLYIPTRRLMSLPYSPISCRHTELSTLLLVPYSAMVLRVVAIYR